MKAYKLLLILAALQLGSTTLLAQDGSDYLREINTYLSQNDCRNAQKSYMTYKYLTDKTDASVEKRIAACWDNQAVIDSLQKAAALDPSKSKVYKELRSAYEAQGNYPEAIKQFDKYFEVEKTPMIPDYFFYGQDLYSAASKYIDAGYLESSITPEQKQIDDAAFYDYIKKGNAAFSEVISRLPESYLGYLWKANLNFLVDYKERETKNSPFKGAAKPYYEEVLQVMLNNNADGKRNKDIIDAYNYLASYYLLLDDQANAGEYYKKILEVDPENADAKKVLDALKVK